MAAKKKSPGTKAKPSAKGPSEIAPGIFVGGWNDALKFEGARFCVLDEAPEDMPPATHVQIYRGDTDRPIPENLDRVAEAIRAAHANGDPVLVFCGHGVRRSPLAGAWYLHRSEGISLDDAYARVQAVRPKVERAREWIGNTAELDKN
jgi:Dual specificity phosphatase, catalytic domain